MKNPAYDGKNSIIPTNELKKIRKYTYFSTLVIYPVFLMSNEYIAVQLQYPFLNENFLTQKYVLGITFTAYSWGELDFWVNFELN